MKRCPSCDGARHYRLADGRLKCHACGKRFSWTSVWDSVRLPAAMKARLLELFVLGVPSYRQGRPVGRDRIDGIESFWSYAKNWLYPYRGVPRQYFHLYLADVCYRYNHHGEYPQPLLGKLLRQTSTQELRPTLVRFG